MDRFSLDSRRYTQTYPQKLGNPLGCKNLVIRNGEKSRKGGRFAWRDLPKEGFMGASRSHPDYRGKISTGITGLF